ncbi:MAG: rhodanese-like domain-containing protein [Fimbriimonadaceae bacterium]
MIIQEISIHELRDKLAEPNNIVLVDVRETEELENGVISGAIHIPMGLVPERMDELNPDAKTVIICRTGNRSRKVTQYLMSRGFMDVSNMSEGMNGWAQEVDTTMVVY